MNAIEIQGLCRSFPDFTLRDVSLTLPSGCILGLVGENGAGKSTTIKLMLNMLRKDSGSITLLGHDHEKDAVLLKEDIGIVLDEAGIPECLTAVQIGKIMRHTFQRWDSDEYARLLQHLSVPQSKPFKDFSRGMKMKLSIAIALSHHAKLLILDEPTGGLDPVVRDEVLDMLYDFTRDESHSILISSHIVSDLEKLCDYIAFLHKGRLLLFEEKDALLSKYAILHCSPEELAALGKSVVKYKKETRYGAEAIVIRDALPNTLHTSPISIEELFLFMVKGEG